MKLRTFVFTAILASACSGAPQSAVAPTASDRATASASAAPTAVPAVRVLANVGGRAVVSPDGKWLARTPPQPGGKANPPYTPIIELYDINGRLTRSTELPTPNWSWMPDSSGLFVALDAPQRASMLGILDIATSDTKPTGLQMSNSTLSRDGKWIVAEHQEGCCMFVTTPEIWMAPRTGGAVRTVVAAKNDPKGLALLGIDATDRVVYRDGTQVLRAELGGGAPQLLGSLIGSSMTVGSDTSPDGSVILVRGYEPLSWYIVANDRVTLSSSVVEDLQGERLLFGTAARWIGPHTFLTRAQNGDLASFDALAGRSSPTQARLGNSDVVLAHDRGRLLVGRGKAALIIDLATGHESDVSVDLLDSDGSRAARAWALPGGGFVLSTLSATYRID